MSSWKSKKIWVGLASLSIFLLASILGVLPTPRVSASDHGAPNFSVCQLPHKSGNLSDGTNQYVTIEFINRVSLKVTFKPDGVKCDNDPSLPVQYLYGNFDVTPYIDGTYTDSDTTNSDWFYKGAAKGSFIKRFVTSGSLKRDNYAHIDTYTDTELQAFLSKAEIVFRVDESKVKNSTQDACNDNSSGALGTSTNRSWDLFFDLKQAGGSWRCRDKDDTDSTGFHVLQAMPSIDSLRNFNIAFGFNGTDIVPIEKKNDSGWHFKSCPNATGKNGTILGTGNCTTGNSFVELDANQLQDLQGEGSYAINVYRSVADADSASLTNVTHTITVGGANNANVKDTAALTGTHKGGSNDGECKGGALSWIFCPIIEGLIGAVGSIHNNLVTPLLTNGVDILTDKNGNDSDLYTAWSGFRIYGDIFLVIALLVIVFGQTIGGGVLDAYTAKKVLPRLLIAAILINLSIYIVALAVDVTSILGSGIAELLKSPFRVQDCKGVAPKDCKEAFEVLFNGVGNQGFGLVGIFGILAGGVAAALIYQTTLLMFLIPVFLNFLAIVVTLLVRQAIIIFLIIISPIAFALYCLPNTEQYFKKWWKLLIDALLVYPIVSILFAMGEIMSHIIGSNNIGGGFSQILAIIAYVAPLFFISFAFKIAGGIVGDLHGFAGGKAGGFNARMAKRRQAKMGSRRQQALSGNALTGLKKYKGGERLNRGIARVSDPASLAPGFLGDKARSRLSTNVSAGPQAGAKQFQELGLQDDTAGNDYISNWRDVGAGVQNFRNQAASLRAKGGKENEKAASALESRANNLSAYMQFSGRRDMALGAAKLNAGFGKLSDSSLEAVGGMFGTSASEKAARSAAWGDLVFTSKNAGNWVSYSAKMDEDTGKVTTYSNSTGAAREEIESRIANNMMDAGPQAYSSIKPYTDKSGGGQGYKTKEVIAKALANNAANLPNKDGKRRLGIEQHARAMENFAMAEQSGAYNDPNMKAALDKAMSVIQSDPQSMQFYREAKDSITRMQQTGENGEPIAPAPIIARNNRGSGPGSGSPPPKPPGEDAGYL